MVAWDFRVDRLTIRRGTALGLVVETRCG